MLSQAMFCSDWSCWGCFTSLIVPCLGEPCWSHMEFVLLWNAAWLPPHCHSCLHLLLWNSAWNPSGRFLAHFLCSPLSVQWSGIARGEDGERKLIWNWDCSAEEMQAQPWGNETNLGRAANNWRAHQKCLNRNQGHIWAWFCFLLCWWQNTFCLISLLSFLSSTSHLLLDKIRTIDSSTCSPVQINLGRGISQYLDFNTIPRGSGHVPSTAVPQPPSLAGNWVT